MSAVVATGAAEPQPLVFDLAAVRAGVKTYVDHRGSVTTYIAATGRVPLGARPIVIGGQVAGSYDPLEKYADLKRGLQAAQWHAQEMARCTDTLHNWGSGAFDDLIGKINSALGQIRDALATVPSGGSLTESQARMAVEQMVYARVYAQLIGMSASQVHHGVSEFLAHLLSDHETLARGPAAIDGTLQQVSADVQSQAMKYIVNPVTAPIGNMIAQIGGQLIGGLKELSAALRGALQGHEEMRTGVSAVANVVESVQAKYQAAEQAVTQGDAANKTAVLRKLKIDTAITSWNQFAEFIRKSGL